MLTQELLQANEATASLSEAQIQAIVQLSQNDENSVLAQRIGEIHGSYDADVLGITGIQKNGSEKSYDYVKRALTSFKEASSKIPEFQTKIESYEAKINELNEVIKSGKGTEALTAQINDLTNQLNTVKSTYTTEKQEWDRTISTLKNEHLSYKTDSYINSATAGFKFKPELPETAVKVLVDAARNQLKSTYAIEEHEGKVILRDKDGNTVLNKANGLNPLTVSEAMQDLLKDVLSAGRTAGGSGSDGSGGKGAEGSTFSLDGIKNQVEADAAIAKHLLSIGLRRGSTEFTEQSMKLRNENGVDKLPVK